MGLFITESKHIYFQYSDARQEKGLLCAQNCTITSCYVTLRHVVVYFQLAMLWALLDLLYLLIHIVYSNNILFKIETFEDAQTFHGTALIQGEGWLQSRIWTSPTAVQLLSPGWGRGEWPQSGIWTSPTAAQLLLPPESDAEAEAKL